MRSYFLGHTIARCYHFLIFLILSSQTITLTLTLSFSFSLISLSQTLPFVGLLGSLMTENGWWVRLQVEVCLMGLGGSGGGGLLDGSRWCCGWLCHGLRLVVGLWWFRLVETMG